MSDNNVQQQYGWEDTELTEANHLLIPEIIALLPKEPVRILDLGCGNGTLAAALQARGHEVVAVDASADIVGTDFDVVISMEVIEHLYWPRKLLEAGYSVLKPGGRMILTTPYHGYLKNLALSLAGGWDKHFTVDWDGGHIKFFSRQTLTQFMQDAGFLNIDFCGVGRITGLWKSMILSGKK